MVASPQYMLANVSNIFHDACACMQDIKLELYRDAQLYTNFIGYLVSRGLTKSSTAKHLAVGKKTLAWLHTVKPWPHTALVQSWLVTLDSQLNLVQPPGPPDECPTALDVWAWVDRLIDYTIKSVNHDKATTM
jgi:hypothetical protein